MLHSSVIQPILIIATVYAVAGCSLFANTPTIAPVVNEHDSGTEVPVVSNLKIVCPTNGRLYPCIRTSVKTPIIPESHSRHDFPVAEVPVSLASPTTPELPDTTPPEAATASPHGQSVSDAHHEAIARELRELIATLKPLIADRTGARPEPHGEAGPEPDPVPPVSPKPDDGAVRDRAPGPDRQPDHAASTRTLLASVYFPFNSVLLAPSEKIVLIDLLAQVRGKRLLLVGFTDRLGDKETNVRVAYRRARAVKAFFLKTGLDPADLFAAAKGQCCYKTDGTTPTGRRQNRRVEIYATTEPLQPNPSPPPLTSE